MTPLRQRMREDMQLRSLAPRTQQSYLGAVQQLAQYFGRSPDQLTPEELRQYFLYLRTERRLAPNTVNVACNAVKFLYVQTLQRPWPLRDLVHLPRAQPLPVVLTPEEVWQVLAHIRRPAFHTLFEYHLRLRLAAPRRRPTPGLPDRQRPHATPYSRW